MATDVRRQTSRGIVHIMGPPDMRMVNERYCTEEQDRHVVVYHTRPVQLADGWMCLACGHANKESKHDDPA